MLTEEFMAAELHVSQLWQGLSLFLELHNASLPACIATSQFFFFLYKKRNL